MPDTPVTKRECDKNVDRMMHSLEKIDKKVDHQTSKIIKLSERVSSHQALHNGVKEATGETRSKAQLGMRAIGTIIALLAALLALAGWAYTHMQSAPAMDEEAIARAVVKAVDELGGE